jgi:hypothetical protein
LLDSAVQTKLDAIGDWDTLTNKPAVIAAGVDQSGARSAIGAVSTTDVTNEVVTALAAEPTVVEAAEAATTAAANEVTPGIAAEYWDSLAVTVEDVGGGLGRINAGPNNGPTFPWPANGWSGITGKPAQISSLVDGPVLDSSPSLIYTDTLHNGFPHMIRRSDGLLVAVWRRGSTHSGGRGQIRRAFSDDNGQTWRNAAGSSSSTSLESSSDQVQLDALLDSRDACLTELSDGRIVMAYFLRQWNPYAWDSDTVVCIRISSDGGLTFDPEVQLPDTFTNYVGHSSPVVELPGGVVWKTIFGSSTDDAIGGDGTVVTYMTSTLDTMHEPEGWAMAPEPIHDGVSGGLTSESNVILNSAGDGVVAAVRFDDLKVTRVYHKPLSGGSWTQVGSFSALSTPRMFRTASGRILVPYRRGEGYEGVGRSALAWSDDDGVTWGGVNTSPLYLDDMSTHRFAYAGLAEVRPGVCVVVYGSEREGDEQGEVWSRPLAVHPVHAPARLEVPAAPWASGGGGDETVLPINGARVYYNATKEGLADGATLVRWNDLSGNNSHIPASANPPVYEVDEEGRLALLFDGVNNYLDIPAVLCDSLWGTVFLVIERLGSLNVQQLISTQPNTGTNAGWDVTWRGTDAVMRVKNGTGTPNLTTIPVTPYAGGPVVAAFSRAPNILRAGIAGEFRTADTGISYVASGASVTRIGQSIAGSAIPFQGRFYAVQVYEWALTVAEIRQQCKWLAQECGITDSGW